MSEANVETIRTVVEALQNREALALLASGNVDLELFDPEIEWDTSGMAGLIPADTAEVYRGRDGVLTYWRRWLESWRDLQFEIQDVRGVGDEVVVLIHNQRQWGRHSGILTELPPFGMVFTFRNGKVVRFRSFPDHPFALEAVGLSE
jgi:ketosteroid isomerase-like protein